MIKDYILLAINNITHRKLRSWLTILGILIGITTVVTLISLSEGMQYGIEQQFRKVGVDRIMINAGSTELGPFGSAMTSEKLGKKELESIKKIKDIRFAAGIITETAKVEYKGEVQYIQLLGVPTSPDMLKEMESIGLFEIEKGRQLRKDDKYKAVLGNKIAHNLFSKDIKIGDKIKIANKEFEVVGIQKPTTTIIHNIIIRIPQDIMRNLFNKDYEFSVIITAAKKGSNLDSVKKEIEEELRKLRKVEEGKEDFKVSTAKEVINKITVILRAVQVVLIGIAAISLIVGGIGIMNTMYTSVLERTREIGIMKALGAKNNQIMLLFLIEAGMLGLVGGIAGVIGGIAISKSIESVALSLGITTLKVLITSKLVIFVLLFSFIIGSFAGMLPARKAALLKPVEALRRW